MTDLAPSPYDHPDLRPAVLSKGLKTFHLADEDGGPACGKDLKHPTPAGALTERGALRRGLTLCSDCYALEEAELEAPGE